MSKPVDLSGLEDKLEKASDIASYVMPRAHKYFKSITPKRSGYARSRTKLQNDEIVADYKYAGKLDEGASRKAPSGMTEPTIKEIEKLVEQYLSRIKD